MIVLISLLFGVVALQQKHNWFDDSMELDRHLEEIAYLEQELISLQNEIPYLQARMEKVMRCNVPKSPLGDVYE